MAYIDVIPLQTAKDYLSIDDTSRDTEITRMIESACRYIENYTNVHLIAKDKTYLKSDCVIKVYDFPINTVEATQVVKGTYSEFAGNSIDLNVGYVTPTDVPSDLVDAGLMILDNWFYNSEVKSKMNVIPYNAKMILDLHKRFFV